MEINKTWDDGTTIVTLGTSIIFFLSFGLLLFFIFSDRVYLTLYVVDDGDPHKLLYLVCKSVVQEHCLIFFN